MINPQEPGVAPSPQEGAPVRHAMSDRVYYLVRSRIIDLEFQPGARLRIEHLRDEFDVSPSPVREALNRLTAEGLVTAEPYRGFRVADLLDSEELRALLQARLVIEDAAARDAASFREAALFTHMRELVDHMDELAAAMTLDVKQFNAADAAFHRTLIEASTNPYLLMAFDSLHAHVQIARHFQGRSAEDARQSNRGHRQVLEALEGGNPEEASLRTKEHITDVVARLGYQRAEAGGQQEHDAASGRRVRR